MMFNLSNQGNVIQIQDKMTLYFNHVDRMKFQSQVSVRIENREIHTRLVSNEVRK